jgi:hypothetical protein
MTLTLWSAKFNVITAYLQGKMTPLETGPFWFKRFDSQWINGKSCRKGDLNQALLKVRHFRGAFSSNIA